MSKHLRLLDTVSAHSQRVYDVAIAADGKRFITTSSDKTAKVWDTDSLNEVAVLKRNPQAAAITQVAKLRAHHDGATFVDISSDGKVMATGGLDKVARLWDLSTGELIHTLTKHTKGISCGSLSADGHATRHRRLRWRNSPLECVNRRMARPNRN